MEKEAGLCKDPCEMSINENKDLHETSIKHKKKKRKRESQEIILRYLPKDQYDIINNKPQVKRRLNSKQKYKSIIKFDKNEQDSMDPPQPSNEEQKNQGNVMDPPSQPSNEELGNIMEPPSQPSNEELGNIMKPPSQPLNKEQGNVMDPPPQPLNEEYGNVMNPPPQPLYEEQVNIIDLLFQPLYEEQGNIMDSPDSSLEDSQGFSNYSFVLYEESYEAFMLNPDVM
ncbi:12642_t:CDS:2, partial [Racocetra fulgida]